MRESVEAGRPAIFTTPGIMRLLIDLLPKTPAVGWYHAKLKIMFSAGALDESLSDDHLAPDLACLKILQPINR